MKIGTHICARVYAIALLRRLTSVQYIGEHHSHARHPLIKTHNRLVAGFLEK